VFCYFQHGTRNHPRQTWEVIIIYL
jgi:hypothetical protein